MERNKFTIEKIISIVSILLAIASFYKSCKTEKKLQEKSNRDDKLISDKLLEEAWEMLLEDNGNEISYNLSKNSNNLVKAKTKIDKANTYFPKNAKSYLLYGVYYEASGNYIDAKNNYEKSLKLDSNYVNTYINFGNLLFKQENFIEAEKAYKKAVTKDPDNFLAYNNLSLLYEKKGMGTNSLKAKKKAIHLNEIKKINQIDTNLTEEDTSLLYKARLGRSYHNNTFKTDISNSKK